MKILFIYKSLKEMGGIQTLIIRLSQYLNQKGHSITLLLNQKNNGELETRISQFVKIIYIKSELLSLFNKKSFKFFDFIYCFDGPSLLLGLSIKKKFCHHARILVGVYHPREFHWNSKYQTYRQIIYNRVLNQIPTENVLFMCSAFAEELGMNLGRVFTKSPIIPIPIDFERFKSVVRNVNPKKIVSLGRLTNFKTYNLKMIDVIEKLNSNGYSFEYHIYGDGEKKQELEEYIIKKNLSKYVYLHGAVPYYRLEEIFSDAFLFLGMGTSLLEAAASGVPCIIGIESNRNSTTYGFFHETLNIGEINPNLKHYDIYEKVIELSKFDNCGYQNLSKITKVKAETFSLENTMTLFLRAFENSEQFNYSIKFYAKIFDVFDRLKWKFFNKIGIEDPYSKRYFHTVP